MGLNLNRWDVCRVNFKFEDEDIYKTRPALVINANQIAILAYKMTSNLSRKDDLEYEIIEWRKAGLDRPTVVRIGKVQDISNSPFIIKLGRLEKIDIDNIKNIMDQNNIKYDSLKENKMLLKEEWFDDYEEQADEYYDNGLEKIEWEEVASKDVPDASGFIGKYTWYENPRTGEHKFFFDDEEDWEEQSKEAAKDWFDSYTGWVDEEEEESFADSTLDEAVKGSDDWDKLVKAFPELEAPMKEDVAEDKIDDMPLEECSEEKEEIETAVVDKPVTQVEETMYDEDFEVDDDISGITF